MIIIIPFKHYERFEWIKPNNCGIMDNKHPHIKYYLRQNYHNFEWKDICSHPAMAEIILKNKDKIVSSIFGNSSLLLTELIVEKFEPTLDNLYYLTMNTNPKLAKLIISQKEFFGEVGWFHVAQNPNTGLTEFIKENYHMVNYEKPFNLYPYPLKRNINPELAELILSDGKITESLLDNPNPGLTKFLSNLPYYAIGDYNTNPELAPLIIQKNRGWNRIREIYINSNVGLTEFIINNPPCGRRDWRALSTNNNPKLEKFIYDNLKKIDTEDLFNLAANRYILKGIDRIKLNL